MTEETEWIIGKRIVAVSWSPIAPFRGTFEIQSITLENGIVLDLSMWNTISGRKIVAEIKEAGDADA